MESCPYCAEALDDGDTQRCSSCGEHLGERAPAGRGRPPWLLLLLICGAVLGVLCLLTAVPLLFLGVAPAPVPGPVVVGGGAGRVIPAPPALPPVPGEVTDDDVAALAFAGPAAYSSGDRRYAWRHAYDWGGFAVVDMGRARIALRGTTFGVHDSSHVPIVTSRWGSGGGSSTAGSMRFDHKSKDGVTTCTLNGLTFTFEDGFLTFGAFEVEVEGTGQAIVVDPDGSNAVLLPAGRAP